MKKVRIQKGITLVVLAITIVVLLILAAVSIGVAYKSGVIGNAQDASSGFEVSDEKEAVELAVTSWKMKEGNTNKTFKRSNRRKFRWKS